jgi:hypothetical protein
MIGKFKCHQKIPWVWWKFKVFHQNFILVSSTVCVQNQTIVANIVSSKSYPRSLLVAFKFSNYHFFSKLWFSRTFLLIYSQSDRNWKKLHPRWYVRHLELLIFQKWRFWHFHTLSYYFFDTFEPILALWDKNRKK